jgi:broad specificity phosphatase PhoE
VKIRTLAVLALALAACAAPPEPPPADPPVAEGAPSVFFLVRHAEKADQSEDPPLTEEGHARARALADLLRDAGITEIFSSDFERTRDTAAPLAGDLGLAVTPYDPTRLPELARTLLSSPGRVLVVGHSNTTPELAGLLGGEPGAPIPETEYDRLYVLHHHPGAGTTTTVLRLGARP